MKNFYKIVLTISLVFTSFTNVAYANEEITEEVFKNVVESSIYFTSYKENIESLDVLRKADTEYGVRYTIQYTLKSVEGDSTLVFVGDQDGTILEGLEIMAINEQLIVKDLIKDYSTTIHTRGPVYKCIRYSCTQWETRLGYQPSPGCSGLVGAPCNVFSLFGHPIVAILCKAGVFVACNATIDKVCTNYYEEIDVCSL